MATPLSPRLPVVGLAALVHPSRLPASSEGLRFLPAALRLQQDGGRGSPGHAAQPTVLQQYIASLRLERQPGEKIASELQEDKHGATSPPWSPGCFSPPRLGEPTLASCSWTTTASFSTSSNPETTATTHSRMSPSPRAISALRDPGPMAIPQSFAEARHHLSPAGSAMAMLERVNMSACSRRDLLGLPARAAQASLQATGSGSSCQSDEPCTADVVAFAGVKLLRPPHSQGAGLHGFCRESSQGASSDGIASGLGPQPNSGDTMRDCTMDSKDTPSLGRYQSFGLGCRETTSRAPCISRPLDDAALQDVRHDAVSLLPDWPKFEEQMWAPMDEPRYSVLPLPQTRPQGAIWRPGSGSELWAALGEQGQHIMCNWGEAWPNAAVKTANTALREPEVLVQESDCMQGDFCVPLEDAADRKGSPGLPWPQTSTCNLQPPGMQCLQPAQPLAAALSAFQPQAVLLDRHSEQSVPDADMAWNPPWWPPP
eukprot:SM000103S09522  [mRNA]  locus=s103:464348:466234:- [translate_table: standard]